MKTTSSTRSGKKPGASAGKRRTDQRGVRDAASRPLTEKQYIRLTQGIQTMLLNYDKALGFKIRSVSMWPGRNGDIEVKVVATDGETIEMTPDSAAAKRLLRARERIERTLHRSVRRIEVTRRLKDGTIRQYCFSDAVFDG